MNLAGARPRAPTQLYRAQRQAEDSAALSSDCRANDPAEAALIQEGLRYATGLVAIFTQLQTMDRIENPRHDAIHGLARGVAGELDRYHRGQCGPDGGAA